MIFTVYYFFEMKIIFAVYYFFAVMFLIVPVTYGVETRRNTKLGVSMTSVGVGWVRKEAKLKGAVR